MTEGEFKRKIRKQIESMLPGTVTVMTDPTMCQGIPDRIFLLPNGRWAAIEAKVSANASHRPNQDYWVEKLREHGYASFVYPENLDEVINEIREVAGDNNDI